MPLTIDLDALQYATDEDVLLTVGDDFFTIAPDSWHWAKGSDGVIDAATPFTLTSATVDFEAAGVTPGRVVRLTARPSTPANLYYGTQEYALVHTVSDNTLTIRRPGLEAGEGQGYATSIVQSGNTTTVFIGVIFVIATVDTHLQRATRRVRADLRRTSGDATLIAELADQDLIDITVYRALDELYTSSISVTAEGSTTPHPALVKAREWRAKYEALLAEMIARVRSTGLIIIV